MLPVDKPVDIEAAVLGIRDASYICLVAAVLIVRVIYAKRLPRPSPFYTQLYDHILTFKVELESFWTLGLTWIRGLFFLVSLRVFITFKNFLGIIVFRIPSFADPSPPPVPLRPLPTSRTGT